jgi:hypothetical protein
MESKMKIIVTKRVHSLGARELVGTGHGTHTNPLRGKAVDRFVMLSLSMLIAAATSIGAMTADANAQSADGTSNIDLSPSWQPHMQTDEERLNSFSPPPPSPPTYPMLQGSGTDTRLYTDPDHSFGGNATRDSVEGNYSFPIPGQ